MNRNLNTPVRLAAILFAGLCIPLPAQEEKQPPAEATEIVELSVSGMTWSVGWAPVVQKALQALPWVRQAEIDFDKKLARVTVEKKSFKPQALVDALKGAGFGGKLIGKSEQDKAAKVDPLVTFHVIGMQKTKSGATWMGWPNAVTEALEGTHNTTRITWDYDNDVVTVAYDKKRTTADKLAEVIHGLGYKTEVVAEPKPKPANGASKPTKVLVPKDAPKFFVEAMRRAQQGNRPVVIDFWSTGCVPCVLLKKLTMEHKDVAKALDSMEVIFVDLDKHPSLGKAYSVKTVPDVFFIDTKGFLVDRLRKFEAVAPFLMRLEKLTGKRDQRPAKKPLSKSKQKPSAK